MSQDIPIQELPNGNYIYQNSRGLYCYQHPKNASTWCENFKTVEEAIESFRAQATKP